MKNLALIYPTFGQPLDTLILSASPLVKRPAGALRVAMSYAPVNPSDLIPVTGAYAHRITLPAVAGYEGVGVVTETPGGFESLLGRRVLPLRGPGTWQQYVDCDPRLAIPLPEDISDLTAARSYINPLAALILLQRWPVAGKHILLTGAGSSCASFLGQWALGQGAASVTGVYRSPGRVAGLNKAGIAPVSLSDSDAIKAMAERADLTFDALGGPVASSIVETMKPGSHFIGYGLLTGLPLSPKKRPLTTYHRFHLRDPLAQMTPEVWQQQFDALWPLLRKTGFPDVQLFPLSDWHQAIEHAMRPDALKPVLDFARR